MVAVGPRSYPRIMFPSVPGQIRPDRPLHLGEATVIAFFLMQDSVSRVMDKGTPDQNKEGGSGHKAMERDEEAVESKSGLPRMQW